MVPIMVPVMVPYRAPPLLPGLLPADVGRFLQYQAARPNQQLSEELESFVGWTLELLILPPSCAAQLQNQLRSWQSRLRRITAGHRLSWTEAFALYGLQF